MDCCCREDITPIRKHIVMSDMVTPATVIRYTGNWQGSFEGWVITPKMGLKQMKQTLPGLKNFYMAGHWVQAGGGLPSALMSGRKAAQLICLHDTIAFRSSPVSQLNTPLYATLRQDIPNELY